MMADWKPPDTPVAAWKPPDTPTGQSVSSVEHKRGFFDATPGEETMGHVAAGIINMLDYPVRATAADVVGAVRGGFPINQASRESFFKEREKSLAATELPEGPTISAVKSRVGKALGAVSESMPPQMALKAMGLQEPLAPLLTIVGDVAGLAGFSRGGLAAVSSTATAAGGTMQRWAQQFADRNNLDIKAANMVAKRLQEDTKAGGPTAQEAIKALTDAKASGKPMVLADVGGKGSNVRGLAGFVARQPGESKGVVQGFLNERDQAAGERLSKDVAQYVHGDASMRETTEALLAARSQAARPLYERAETLSGIWSPRLQEFLEEPLVKRGLARGYELERLDALAEGRPFDPTAMGVDLDADGNVSLRKVPNVRVLDMGKRGLDAMIADERDPITGRVSARGRSLDMVRHAYVGEIDDLDTSGVYKSARQAWAGPSQSLDSLRFGRTIFNRSPEETTASFNRMAPNDQEFARLGVADILRERIAKTGFTGDESRAIIKNPWTREQLRPITRTEEDFNNFVDAVMAERTMAGTNQNVLGGSSTAERVAEDASPKNRAILSAMQTAWHAAHANVFSAAVHAYRFNRELKAIPNPVLNEKIAKLLFSTDPKFVESQIAPKAKP